MASYTTQLLDWGETGVAYPIGYSYTSDIPPIEEYDDFAMFNMVKDIKHLVSLTNERLESSSGEETERPASPEDGELFWNSTDANLEVYDAAFSGWRVLAVDGNVSGHISDTNNPHQVSLGQLTDVTATAEGSGGGFDSDTVDGLHADDIGVVVEEDGTPRVSPTTAIDFTGHLNVVDDGDGTVTIDPTHNHDADYVNENGDTMSGDLDMGGNSLLNAGKVTATHVETRTSAPSSPEPGQMWIIE